MSNIFDFNTAGPQRNTHSVGSDPVEVARLIPIEQELERRGYSFKRDGKDLNGPCPVCGGDDRFVITPSKALWHCRICDDGGDVIKLVQKIDKCEFLEAIETLTGKRPERHRINDDFIARMQERARKEKEEEERKAAADTAYALRWWNEAGDIYGTPAETYLKSRHCDGLFPPLRDAVFRYHPACVFGNERLPCLLTLLRNIETDEPQAVHRTALTHDGQKIDRKMMGPKSGAAIKLWPQASKGRLVVGEGVETVLSAALHLTIRGESLEPAWCLVDAGGVQSLPPLPNVDKLVILVDNDAPDAKTGRRAGQEAAAKCVEEWSKAGREVIRLTPKIEGSDFNDLVKDEALSDCENDVDIEIEALDPGEKEAKAEEASNETKHSAARFKLVPFEAINLSTEPNYLIKGIIPHAGLTVIWGPPKCGKSFWCLNAFMSVARNTRYRDRKVKGGPVVYIALEGHRGFEARISGYRQHCMEGHRGPVSFFLIGGTLDLIKDHVELIACIQTQIGDTAPAAVVIDTLNRSLSGSESSDTDMSAYIKAADTIRDTFACAVAVVHHCGHDTSRPRGHTSLFGAADCMISVRRDAAGNVVTTVQHMKDGEPSEPMIDRLESVSVGTDDDGDPITTCIVRPVDGVKATDPDTRKSGSDREVLAMEALTEALLDHGQPLPASLRLTSGMKGCKLDQWKGELYARSVLDRGKDTSREKFSRLRDRLVRKRMIGVRNDWVWLVKAEGAASFTPDL